MHIISCVVIIWLLLYQKLLVSECYKANTSLVSRLVSNISYFIKERTQKKVYMEQDTTEGEYLIPFQKLLTNVEKIGFHVKKETT